MSFSADQFMQVKCKFQLTSETESSESIISHNERVRLCTSVDIDKYSSLIILICSNETSNNHIVAYYIERRPFQNSNSNIESNQMQNLKGDEEHKAFLKTPPTPQLPLTSSMKTFPNASQSIRSKIIIKQIYYHHYNEDIVAICLSASGNKLTLVNASSTIYVLPIKNILLNLHAKQLRSSQAKSMYFYDASILHCCSLSDPIAVAYWESLVVDNQSTVVVANDSGMLSFISVEEKREISATRILEHIKLLEVIKDMFSYSLLITCENLKQYRIVIELIKNQANSQVSNPNKMEEMYGDEYIHLERDLDSPWSCKPLPVKLGSPNSIMKGKAAAVIHRVLRRSDSSSPNQGKVERSSPLVMYQPNANLASIVDAIGKTNSKGNSAEPRFLRFFPSDRFYYRPQEAMLICKLNFLKPNEVITNLVLTDRLLAIATDHDRCLICSRNCCNLKNSGLFIDLDPLVKEITFSNEEKILLLIKSPVSNDQDGIIDSFSLVTNRSIYTIEARQSCRDMFTNLIDTHLGIKPSLPLPQSFATYGPNQNTYTVIANRSNTGRESDSNLLVSSFLCYRDEVYERITYDSKAFSVLFKLGLNSLYEAYGDKLLKRGRYELANRFFQMAKFDNAKILGKYIRLATHKLSTSEMDFLEFITCQEVTKELVKDIEITSEYLGYPRSSLFFHKYSYSALSLMNYFKKLVELHQTGEKSTGLTKNQRQSVENIFITFLTACLEESIEDSCNLWSGYINFYLNFSGTVEELETDIMNLSNSNPFDCRIITTFYMAIGMGEDYFTNRIGSYLSTRTPSEPAEKVNRLSELFKNEFLLRLLEKTLDLVPRSTDMNALSDSCWNFFIEKGLTKELYSIA